MVAGWSSQMLPSNYQSAKERAAQVQQYLQGNPTTPLLESVQAYGAYLSLGLETASIDGPWKNKLQKLLGNPIVGSLRCLDTTDGLRYYVTSAVQVHSSDIAGVTKSQSFDAITSPDVSHPTPVELRVPHLLKSTTPVRSPQAVFAQASASRLDSLDYRDWDLFGLDTLSDFTANRDINPVLRGILLQHILQLNQPVAVWSGQEVYGKVADGLVALNIEDIEWLDPRHPADADVLQKLQTSIDKLPQPLAAKAAVLKRREEVLKPLQIEIIGEGILLRGNDAFELVTTTAPVSGRIALAVGNENKLVGIGQVEEKRWSLNATNTGAIPDGSLVFIVSPPK